jgi:peptidoglycan hydrolase CwlO-like protein
VPVLVLSLLLAWGLGARPAAACDESVAACQQLQQSQQQQTQAEQQLNQIRAQSQGEQAKADAIANLVASLQSQMAAQVAAIQATEAKIAETERQMRFTQASLLRAQAHLDTRQELLNQRVRSMAADEPLDYLQIVATANSFTQFMDRIGTVRAVIRSQQRMVSEVRDARNLLEGTQHQLGQQRAEQESLLDSQRTQEQQLNASLATQQQGLQEEQAIIASLQAQGGQVQDQIAALSARISSLSFQYQQQLGGWVGSTGGGRATSGNPIAPLFSWVPAGGFPDWFPFGQCTWWAAYNHHVSWSGNATDWFDNAISQGAAVSSTPRVGSVAVWRASPSYPTFGHVAIVTGVNGNGSFTVSEMNYVGLGIVDTRTTYPSWELEGFIL